METFTATRVEIRSDRAQPRQLDGDLIDPGTQLLITVRPKALLLCAPRPDAGPGPGPRTMPPHPSATGTALR